MIALTVTSRVHTWLVRLDVSGAPDTKRDYSDHMIHPDRLEISYRAANGNAPSMSSVRLSGTRVRSSPAFGSHRISAEWYTPERLPDWIRPIVQEYAP